MRQWLTRYAVTGRDILMQYCNEGDVRIRTALHANMYIILYIMSPWKAIDVIIFIHVCLHHISSIRLRNGAYYNKRLWPSLSYFFKPKSKKETCHVYVVHIYILPILALSVGTWIVDGFHFPWTSFWLITAAKYICKSFSPWQNNSSTRLVTNDVIDQFHIFVWHNTIQMMEIWASIHPQKNHNRLKLTDTLLVFIAVDIYCFAFSCRSMQPYDVTRSKGVKF